ncbi:trehalose-phosphatase [Fodinicurvata fenggangensis]|uniref:trehalose-phosphatase n=1 Tax=Fodinicurvata fenggangensis TaxID=1121830 RepID=UPI000689986E|nr:trehalose-phosphatase [Fodinicurvata fenggangensis]
MTESDAQGLNAASPARLEAVLFDMDGVVTDTAQAHAAAWKHLFDEFLCARAEASGDEYRPFDPEREYREFVDGKPRHAGIKSFLRSRGIDLPEGTPEDPPDANTVFGLGRRKQNYFRTWLRNNEVRSYPGTLKLIRELRKSGTKTAVFSSSRNAEDVLRNAGVLDLFDARVDGNDLAELSLRGKPDPAMLHEATARLGVKPEGAAVIEDAIAGVEAGARSGFALVIGIDRGCYGEALKEAGAHLVVDDLSELVVSKDRHIAIKMTDGLPAFWDSDWELRACLSGRSLAVFLDYDGTLTPIVEDHTKAFLDDGMRAAIAELARSAKVAIISGRDLQKIQQLVKIDSLFVAGSHGFEIAGPDGTSEYLERGVEFLPKIEEAERRLHEGLSGIDGHSVERKRFSIAVHYRRVAERDVPRMEAVVDEVLSACGGLRKGHGKKVFRIQPDLEWHKGCAVLWLLERFRHDDPNILPVYVGDDITDEDAFRALAGRGLTIVVRDREERRTAADYAVADTDEVRQLIAMLAVLAAEAKDRKEVRDEA